MRWLQSLFGRGKRRWDDAPAVDSIAGDTPEPITTVDTGPRERRFALERERFFDLDQTGRLAALLEQPRDARDPAWFDAFHDAVWHASLSLPWDTPVEGPDGFPYLRLDVPPGGEFESHSLGALAPQCVAGGFGAVVFASPNDPIEQAAFVFSMGRLDSILRFDDPEGDPVDRADASMPADDAAFDIEHHGGHQQLTVKAGHEVMIGAPSTEYLPPSSARHLYNHLVDGWGIDRPRIALMLDPKMRPTRSLVLGQRRSAFPEQAPIDEMMNMLLWFLPPGQMLMLMPEGFDDDRFVPLANYLKSE